MNNKNNNLMISVVMPVYNAERYLDEAIQSILTQTYKDFEFIIINDGSIDNSLKIIKKYQEQDSRIILINRENKGFVYSLNEAIYMAKGDCIARMDADDISLPNRFKEQVQILDTMNNIDVIGCNYQLIDNQSKITGEVKVPITNNDILMSLCYSVPFAHPSVMIRKSVFDSVKYENNPTEDYLLWSKIYKNNNFYNLDKCLFQYRHHYGSSFSDTKRAKMMEAEGIISKSFFMQNKEKIITLFETKINSIYFIRALVSIFIYSDKKYVLKLFFKKPMLIFNFMKYYFRHQLRNIYWKSIPKR